jgi:hypothetical protein
VNALVQVGVDFWKAGGELMKTSPSDWKRGLRKLEGINWSKQTAIGKAFVL